MSLEPYFTQYPNLKAVFWPNADTIKWAKGKPPHPLVALVQNTDDRAKHVAGRTDHCCLAISRHSPNWLKAKAAIVLTDEHPQNISATLGEIRAFGELIWVWQDKVKAGKHGHDFEFAQEGQNIRVEVFTQQHRTKRDRIEHPRSEGKRISSQVIEFFPFGQPERPEKDNVQGEAVSKLAGMKQDEHQFSESDINILWCDLKDPMLWMFGFDRSQFAPLSMFQEQITSGAFWNAYYAKKATPIFDALPVAGYLSRNPYSMEFEGRFWRKTKLDFVIADTAQRQIVFQNHKQNKKIPDWLFRDLHRLAESVSDFCNRKCIGELMRDLKSVSDIRNHERLFHSGSVGPAYEALDTRSLFSHGAVMFIQGVFAAHGLAFGKKTVLHTIVRLTKLSP